MARCKSSGLTLALPGMQHEPRSGHLLLHVRAEQPVKAKLTEEARHASLENERWQNH